MCKTFLCTCVPVLSLTKKQGEDNFLLMKTIPLGPRRNFSQLSGVTKEIVCDLLDALTIPVPPEETTTTTPSSTEIDGATEFFINFQLFCNV